MAGGGGIRNQVNNVIVRSNYPKPEVWFESINVTNTGSNNRR